MSFRGLKMVHLYFRKSLLREINKTEFFGGCIVYLMLNLVIRCLHGIPVVGYERVNKY